jgi:hypothetical protein
MVVLAIFSVILSTISACVKIGFLKDYLASQGIFSGVLDEADRIPALILSTIVSVISSQPLHKKALLGH